MQSLKDIYNKDFVSKLSTALEKHSPAFNTVQFHDHIFQSDWDTLALKQRMRRITQSMHQMLPTDYPQALSVIEQVAPHFTGLAAIIFPDYVEQCGLLHWDLSIQALERFTTYSTAEFAVRPFILLDRERMLTQFIRWTTHPNEHVRRLASEGSRPRLPWGMAIPAWKKDPSPLIPILEALKEDTSLYVRKSVANHLNDISKTHPGLVLEIARKWYGKNEHTDWIVKHACRTLLKKGDKDILQIFGYKSDNTIQISNLRVTNDSVFIGDSLTFSFSVETEKTTKVRLEYAIDYVKARGNRTRKVFKIAEKTIPEGSLDYVKVHHFKDLTTRKHYEGLHTISVIVNGEIKATVDFSVNKQTI